MEKNLLLKNIFEKHINMYTDIGWIWIVYIHGWRTHDRAFGCIREAFWNPKSPFPHLSEEDISGFSKNWKWSYNTSSLETMEHLQIPLEGAV